MNPPAELVRFSYGQERTLGWLSWGDVRLATLERPWIPADDHKGGRIRVSCVPDGLYRLIPHTGPGFQNVWGLENAALDVHYMPAGRGRSAILIHQGNRVIDVVGCIAIGRRHGMIGNEPSVLESANAMADLRGAWNPIAHDLPTLVIRPTTGTGPVSPWRKP